SCTADTSARRASPTAPTASSAISAHSSPRRWPTDFFDADLRGSVLGRGSLSRLAGGSSALAVARFLAACWLGGWCSRDKRGRRSRKVAAEGPALHRHRGSRPQRRNPNTANACISAPRMRPTKLEAGRKQPAPVRQHPSTLERGQKLNWVRTAYCAGSSPVSAFSPRV